VTQDASRRFSAALIAGEDEANGEEKPLLRSRLRLSATVSLVAGTTAGWQPALL